MSPRRPDQDRSEADSGSNSSDDELVRQIRRALAHLHDPAYPQTLPLLPLPMRAGRSLAAPTGRGRSLQQSLLQAVDSLKPSPGAPAGARSARLIDAACGRLGVGRTEYFRDRRRAIAAVISALSGTWALEPEQRRAGGRRAAPEGLPAPLELRPTARHLLTPALPAQLTSFVGRETQIDDLTRLLSLPSSGPRLLTLTGAGGCGKTRLALRVAAELLENYTDGVWLVELAAIRDPELVPRAVATALSVAEMPGRSLASSLIDHLCARILLLVLDNCEHLVGACSDLADMLLRACPGLRILATSRELLGVTGELAWRVPPLTSPDPDKPPPVEPLMGYEAVHLFVDRASLVQPGFRLAEANALAVARICRRLDGMPLAIELAAARASGLAVEQIAARLDDRFGLLTGGRRTALRRQQTLRATIDWSHDLLAEPEGVLFRRLAVFAGGWLLEAAEAVCSGGELQSSQVLDLLDGLARKSLVAIELRGGRVRYRLPETIRQYALERLLASPESETVRQRHAEHCTSLVESWPSTDKGVVVRDADRATFVDEAESELPDLRAALRWLLETGQAERGLRLLNDGLSWFLLWRGHLAESRQWHSDFLALPSAMPRTAELGWALANLSFVAYQQGDVETTRELAAEGLAIGRELGDDALIALGLGSLAWVSIGLGRSHEAVAFAAESVQAMSRLGDGESARASMYVKPVLGAALHSAGDNERAERVLREVLADLERNGAAMFPCRSLFGRVLLGRMDWRGAVQQFALVLPETLRLGHVRIVAEAIDGMAVVAAQLGEWKRAARLFGAAAGLLEGIGAILNPEVRADADHYQSAARATLGEEVFIHAWAERKAMTLEQAVEYALQEV